MSDFTKQHFRSPIKSPEFILILMFYFNLEFTYTLSPTSVYTFPLMASFLEICENFLMRNFRPRIWTQHPKLSLIPNFLIPKVCDIDFMAIMNLIIYMGFDYQNRSGCNFTPSSVIIHGQSPYKCSNLLSS